MFGDLSNIPKKLTSHSLILVLISTFFSLLSIRYFDQTIAEYFADPALSNFRLICRELTDLGLSPVFFIPSLIAYCCARWILPRFKWLQSKQKLILTVRKGANFSVQAFVVVGVVAQILKIIFGRQRPHVSETYDSWVFHPLSFHWHWHSFPSGHSQVVFVAATVAMIFWPRFKYLFLSFAVGIAFTRIVTHQHFLSDTIFGATLGYLGTLWFYQNFFYPRFLVHPHLNHSLAERIETSNGNI